MAREGFDVVSIDGSFSALIKARQRNLSEDLGFAGVASCVTQLPFTSSVFDMVIDVACIQHNCPKDVEVIFKEVARVLKKGGKLLSIVPTNRSSRKPMQGYKTTFFEEYEFQPLLGKEFKGIAVLRSSYQLMAECTVENWILTAERK